jgi:A/G-specific adenine glycosylase
LNEREKVPSRLVDWFTKNARNLPWRRTRDPYAIWISEIMLQQTQVKTVIPYWERWMQHFPTVASLAIADEQHVLKLWEGLGYYTRARNLQKAARIICEKHSRTFPRAFDEILALPGIGRYTAGAIASIAYGDPTPILDGNVIRVLSRQFAIEGDPRSPGNQKHLWHLSTQLVTASNSPSALNQGLMELGATLCTPRDPQCPACPIRTTCAAFRLRRVADFPQIPPRKKPRQRRFIAYILRHGDSVLVRKRSSGVVNGNLWEFPNFEVNRGSASESAAALAGRFIHLKPRPFATIKHTITNNRITLQASHAEVNGESAALATELSAKWHPIVALDQLPFSSAHARLRSLLLSGS